MKTENFVSWYSPELKFTKAQQNYVNLLKETFVIWDAFGRPVPYQPLPYQQEYHSKFFLCLPEDQWKDRIVRKGRGIGFTISSMIDMVMACQAFDDITIPVVSHREQEAYRLIKIAQKLVDKANVDLNVKRPHRAGQVEFLNGSKILPFPAGSVDAVRSNRAPCLFYDEMEFYPHPDELLAAGDDILNEGGQKTIGSTVKSRNSLFWMLWKRANEGKLSWYWWDLPVFDRENFSQEVNIVEQVKKGLQPLGWWYNFKKMEDRRNRDVITFMQENMCIPADEGASFLGWEYIANAMNHGLILESPRPANCFRTLGVDFARKVDQSAWTIFDWTLSQTGQIIKKQVWWEQFTGVSTPRQIEYGSSLIHEWEVDSARIDMSGNGLGLFEGLEDIHGNIIEGFNPSTVVLAGDHMLNVENEIDEEDVIQEYRRKYKDEKKTIKTRWKIAINLRSLLQRDEVWLIRNEIQAEQLNAIDHELRAPNTKYGHSDIFWAVALAIAEPKQTIEEIKYIGDVLPWAEDEKEKPDISAERLKQIRQIIDINEALKEQGVIFR